MAKSANDKSGYIIGLVVFVLLTFVLAVTNYFAYKWGLEKEAAAQTARQESNDSNKKMLTARNQRAAVIKELLGVDLDDLDTEDSVKMESQFEEIKARKKKQIDDVFGEDVRARRGKSGDDAGPPVTYVEAVDWLASSIKTHGSQMKACEDAKNAFEAEKKKVVAEKEKDVQDKDAKLKELQASLEEKQQELSKYQEDSTKQKDELVAERKKADDKLALLKALSDEIARCKDHLSVDRQRQWPGPAGDGDAAADGGSDIERLKLMFAEMRDKDRIIASLNQVIAQLRVADQAIQKIVRDAVPSDDLIDGFDGRVLSVNEKDRTVLLALGSTGGIRPGLIFYVYDPEDPQPQIAAKKGVVEVVGIEGSLVRARVRQDATRKPILPGDAVATSLWTAGSPLEVVLVGLPQFGSNAETNARRFAQIVERLGGTVATEVTPTTTLVVDGGFAKSKGTDAGIKVTDKRESDADARRREKRDKEQIKEANRLGIKVVAMEPFLGMVGLQLDAVGANRLPVPADQRAAPARPENVAY